MLSFWAEGGGGGPPTPVLTFELLWEKVEFVGPRTSTLIEMCQLIKYLHAPHQKPSTQTISCNSVPF